MKLCSNKILFIIRCLLCFCFFQSAHATLIFQVNIDTNTGELLGADNIDIGGTFYDVSFLDGHCATLFSGCNEVSDFLWTTETAARQANEKLISLVFIDNAYGMFDSDPNLTKGCEYFNVPQCGIHTPFFDTSIKASRFSNSAAVNDFPPDIVNIQPAMSTIGNLNTWAVWSLSTVNIAAIPEPKMFAVFLTTLLLLRRKVGRK